MEINDFCPSCFKSIGAQNPCPYCGFDRTKQPENLHALKIGTILNGQYLVGYALGQGGFGITYLCYDLNLKDKVAIKEYFPANLVVRQGDVVRPTTPQNQTLFQKGVDSFYREAENLASFRSKPNVVSVFNFFRENGTAYFVMEFVEGHVLKDIIIANGGSLSLQDTAKYLLPVMQAMEIIHEAGLLHRDISPDNIYILNNNEPKLLDFGSARYNFNKENRNSTIVVKPGYTPLEQYSNKGQGAWTDVYAMGAVFYRSLTGKLPPEATDRLYGEQLTPISAYIRNFPSDVEQVILKAMAVDAKNRYQTMSEFYRALVQAMSCSSARQNSQKAVTTELVNSVVTVQKRKKPSKVVIFLIVFISILSFLGLFLFTGRRWFTLPKPPSDSTSKISAILETASKTVISTESARFTSQPVVIFQTPMPVSGKTPEQTEISLHNISATQTVIANHINEKPNTPSVSTAAATKTAVPTKTFTATATRTAIPTRTPTATATRTAVPTKTFTAIATRTAIPTRTFTATATRTAIPTRTPTATATRTAVPTKTFTATATRVTKASKR